MQNLAKHTQHTMLSTIRTIIMFTNEKHHDLDHHIQLLIFLSLAVAFAVLGFRRAAKKSVPPLPPGPYGLPLLGYLPFLSQNLHHDFSKLAAMYGPIFKFWLGSKLCVVITSAPLVREVVRDQDAVFANRGVSTCAMVATHGGHDIAFASYGPHWKKLRKIFVKEMSNNTVLSNLCSLRRDEVKKSISRIYSKSGTPVDVRSLAFLTAVNSVMSMTMMSSSSTEGDNGSVIDGGEFQKAAEELLGLIGKVNVSDIFPVLAWFDIQGIERDTRKVSQVFEAMFDSAITNRKKDMTNQKANSKDDKQERRKDFLQFLLELHNHEHEDTAKSITMQEIKALLMDTLLGATDTTTTMVEWAMTELLKNPEIASKVQAELTKVVGLNNNVEEFHLSKLTYLNAVMKETFRLHPPLPFLVPRSPSQSAIVGGYDIPKGATIFINVWAMQRDPLVWENPSEFRPERFLIAKGDQNQYLNYNYSGNNFNYLPFGSGRRMCAGAPLGEKMVMLTLASFLHYFEWELSLGTKLELSDKVGMIIKKREPLIAVPTPRLSDSRLYI